MGFRIIGKPAKPYDARIVDAVMRALQSVDGIAEAHMPQWCEDGLTNGAEQVVVIVLAKGRSEEEIAPILIGELGKQLPNGPLLLVIPIRGSSSDLTTVRGTQMLVFRRPGVEMDAKPWWRFW